MSDEQTKKKPDIRVLFEGPEACFTLPPLGVDRSSYLVPTVPAADGLLRAVYWHPEMFYKVRKIVILNEIKTMRIMTNEVRDPPNLSAMLKDEKGAFCDPSNNRTQRLTIGLRDVAYIIEADVIGIGTDRLNQTEMTLKQKKTLLKRLKKNRQWHQPYFGMRQMAVASWRLPTGDEKPIAWDADLGNLLFQTWAPLPYRSKAKAKPEAKFFHAKVEGGVVTVPQHLYDAREALYKGPQHLLAVKKAPYGGSDATP